MPSPSTLWLPAIISDNMVLQARVSARIWGRCSPRERIRATIAGVSATAKADAHGRFELSLPPLKPGGPYELRLTGLTERVISNVLVGDVWLASGQSNMEWWVRDSTNGPAEMAAALYPRIRIFSVPASASTEPLDDVEGCWRECNPQTIRDFSAVAYFFGRDIFKKIGQPLGLINTSWGGTRIEPWISLPALKRAKPLPKLVKTYQKFLDGSARHAERESFYKDTLNTGLGRGWASETCDTSRWKSLHVPGCWTADKKHGVKRVGAFWFRRAVTLPKAWAGLDLRLELGSIVDFDATYFNGQLAGATPQGTPGAWNISRNYVVPGAIVKPGKNTLAVRIFAHGVNGGFAGSPDALQLSVVNRPELGRVPLAGDWSYTIERELEQKGPVSQALVPSTVYNAMIHPLARFALRGFLWYQGESNIADAPDYQRLFELMIRDWREQWGDAELPFYFVQLSDFERNSNDDLLARLREAQLRATRAPHTGMAVSVDGGEKDVHARNKQMVGARLALLALRHTYGKKVECSGPLYRSFKVEGAAIRIAFDHAARGLKTTDGKPPGDFVIAGADAHFVPAQARIENGSVVVWNPAVTAPRAVRYAWSDAPRCTLLNHAGLPASPFRTDQCKT